MRPIVDGLVEDGSRPARGGRRTAGAPVVVPAGAEVDGAVPPGGVLLSPFDSLLWDKPFVERVFGFAPLIEVYKREHERIYGYYVLPFLLGDRLVGSRRSEVRSRRGRAPREGVPRRARACGASKRLDDAFDRALARLAACARARVRRAMNEVSLEEARRIAVHAQLLDGSATTVLDTVRQLGFLQIDPISTVAPPQHLVLWSRLGARYDPAELDRLLWEEQKLFEWARVHPADRGSAADPRSDAAQSASARMTASARATSSSRRTRATSAICSASSSATARCSRARSPSTRRRPATPTAGGATGRWRSC